MPKKLLVADKSVVIQKSVGITFAQEDFSVTYVSDGEDALNRTRQFKPDLILIHVQTPKLSGYDVCDAVKKDPQLKHIPVLFLVGIHEQYDEARAKACGAEGSIIKPFESQALIDKVNELISRKVSPPPPAAPSPTATLAGPMPVQPPRPESPSPFVSSSATIAGQAPMFPKAPHAPTPPAQAFSPPRQAMPMLDLNVPLSDAPAAQAVDGDAVFEFALDDSFTAEAPPEPPQAPRPASAASAPSAQTGGADIWEFGEAGATEPAVATDWAAEPQDQPVSFAEVGGLGEVGSQAPEFSFADAADEPTVAAVEIGAPESVFDFSAPPEVPAEPPPAEPAAPAPAEEKQFIFGGSEIDFSAPEPAVAAPPVSAQTATLTDAQIEAIVTKVFGQVIERIAWEVVPDLAETIIKEELKRLTQDRP